MIQATDSGKYNLVDYGFQITDEEFSIYNEIMQHNEFNRKRRELRWEEVYFDKHKEIKVSAKLKRFCRKGIPDHCRARIWMHISGAQELKNSSRLDRYQYLKNSSSQEYAKQIRCDLERTFPNNIYFDRSQEVNKSESLFNVLTAFANNHQDIGYLQGLNFIAATCILVTHDEENSYWLMEAIVQNLLVDGFFHKDISGILKERALLNEIIAKVLPKIHAKIMKLGIDPALLLDKFMITMFSRAFPITTVFRIWDIFMLEGEKIILRAAVAVIELKRESILEASDTAEVFNIFSETNINRDRDFVDCNAFIEKLLNIKKMPSSNEIRKMRLTCYKDDSQVEAESGSRLRRFSRSLSLNRSQRSKANSVR